MQCYSPAAGAATFVWNQVQSSADILVPFHKDFSPSGEHREHRIIAHELLQPTAVCIAIFHKYCRYTKRGSIATNMTLQNLWGHVTDVSKYHNVGKWSMRFMFKNI